MLSGVLYSGDRLRSTTDNGARPIMNNLRPTPNFSVAALYSHLRCHFFLELPSHILHPVTVLNLPLRYTTTVNNYGVLRSRLTWKTLGCCSNRVEVPHLLFFHCDISSISHSYERRTLTSRHCSTLERNETS